jgi:hypothetical protein
MYDSLDSLKRTVLSCQYTDGKLDALKSNVLLTVATSQGYQMTPHSSLPWLAREGLEDVEQRSTRG